MFNIDAVLKLVTYEHYNFELADYKHLSDCYWPWQATRLRHRHSARLYALLATYTLANIADRRTISNFIARDTIARGDIALAGGYRPFLFFRRTSPPFISGDK